MPYMFPILTDRPHTKISSKTYRQSMPYIYPEAGRERKNEICGAKKSKSLKKSTLRAKKKTIVTGENLDSATGPIKKLDPAKITHSIPDFVSRNQIHTCYMYPRYLARLREHLAHIQDQDLPSFKSIFWDLLRHAVARPGCPWLGTW